MTNPKMMSTAVETKSLRPFEVLTNDINALTIIHGNTELTFDFGDEDLEDTEATCDDKNDNEESEFVLEENHDNNEKEDEKWKRDDDFFFEIKTKDEESSLVDNSSYNIDNIVHKTSSELWKCNVCSKEMKSLFRMRTHAEKHIPGISYPCLVCEKTCKTRQKLRIHQKKIHKIQEKIKQKKEISSEPIVCTQPECEYKAQSKTRLNIHKKVRHNEKFLSCKLCDFVTKKYYSFKDHKTTKHKMPVFCDQCPYNAKHKKFLRLHKVAKHSDEASVLFCDQCSYKSPVSSYLKHHKMLNHSKDQLLCEKCDFKTPLRRILDEHVKVQHEGFRYECGICDYTGTTLAKTKNHKNVVHHGKLFLCERCEFKTSKSGHLKHHVSVKHEGLIFLCESCDYQTTKPDSLKQHIRVSHEGMTYQCNLCTSRYTRRDKMKNHQKKKHSNNTEELFTLVKDENILNISSRKTPLCLECGKSHRKVEKHYSCELCANKFSQKQSLRNHMKETHKIKSEVNSYEDNNPLHCHTCKKAIFSETYHLYHMDTQHVEKTEFYSCRFCDYKVKVKTPHSLLEHLRTHTGERPEKCNVCEQTFKTKKTLSNHHKTHMKTMMKEDEKSMEF